MDAKPDEKRARDYFIQAFSEQAWASHKQDHLAMSGATLAALVALTCVDREKVGGWLLAALSFFSLGLPLNLDLYMKSRRSRWHYAKLALGGGFPWRKVGSTLTVLLGFVSLIAHHSGPAAVVFLLACLYIVYYGSLDRLLGRRRPSLDELLIRRCVRFGVGREQLRSWVGDHVDRMAEEQA